MNQRSSRWVALFALFVIACGPTEAPDSSAAQEVLPPGDLLPGKLELYLYGTDRGCEKDADCDGVVCSYGRCMGVLQADARWMQEQAAEVLAAAAKKDPELVRRLTLWVSKHTSGESNPISRRVRGLVILEKLGAHKVLKEALKRPEKPIADAAALALCRVQKPQGLERAAALARSTQVAVQIEAVDALGLSQQREALKVVLPFLSPTLDRNLVFSAIRALKRLNDPRAIRSLVAFWEDAPAFLVHSLVDALRVLTSHQGGVSRKEWVAWIEANQPPAAPSFERYERSAVEDLGIPEP